MGESGTDPKVIKTSPGERDIVLRDKPKAVFFKTNSYEKSLNISTKFWNEIVIHHENLYTKSQIIKQFCKFFNSFEFFPVNYKHDTGNTDSFLIRLTEKDMDTFFANGLKLLMHDGRFIYLSMRVNVADHFDTQISHRRRIEQAVTRQRSKVDKHGFYTCLNLNSFGSNALIKDHLTVTLTSEPALQLLCDTITRYTDLCRDFQNKRIDGIKLQSNEIRSLAPIAKLSKLNIKFLDLSHNNIENLEELDHLKNFKDLEQLNMSINSITGLRNYELKIREVLPDLKNLDGRELVRIKREKLDSPPPGDKSNQNKKPLPNLQAPPPPRVSGPQQSTPDTISASDLNSNFDLSKYRTSQNWHKVTVEHQGKATKAEILPELFKLIDNTDFYPTFYKETPAADIFFLRRCMDALVLMLKNKMIVEVGEHKIPMKLQMNAVAFQKGDVDPPNVIIEAIGDRFNFMDKRLDLSNFGESPQFKDIIINMSNSKALNLVLTMCGRKFGALATAINLSRNGIVSGTGMGSLVMMKLIRSLDFSHNKIVVLKEFLETFPTKVKCVELVFNGNPLCSTFSSASDYMKLLKTFFPELEKLDGVTVGRPTNIAHQNYLCDISYYDLVDNFLRKYFKIYDSVQRFYLRDFYHPSAIYSMSINYDQAKMTVANSVRINRYLARSRNLLKMANLSQSMTNLKLGNLAIIDYFIELPITEHDLRSFKIDMTVANEEMICFTIHGLFKETGTTIGENELWLGFTRTFILKPVAIGLGVFRNGSQFKIINDQVSIVNLTMNQIKWGFKAVDAKKTTEESDDLTEFEKEVMVRLFQDITNMKTKWCQNCLEKSDWILPNAIETFMKLYEENRIPQAGFIPVEID